MATTSNVEIGADIVPQTITELPLIAVGRAVEKEAERWLKISEASRVINFVIAAVGLLLTVLEVLPDDGPLIVVGITILLEFLDFLVFDAKAGALQSLSRQMLQRALYVGAGMVTDNALRSTMLKTQAEADCKGVKETARKWLYQRIDDGKAKDGTDFYSTKETDPEIRLLEILFENNSWWEEFSKRTAARYALISVAALSITIATLVLVAVLASDDELRVSLVSVVLQGFLLFASLRVFELWRKWKDAALSFKIQREKLSSMITLEHLELGELHSFVTDYAVTTKLVAPVPIEIVEEQFKAIDGRVQAELRSREKIRADAKQTTKPG